MPVKLVFFIAAFFFLSNQDTLVLKIEITGLKSNKGHVILELLDENKNSIKGVIQEIINKESTITIKDLPPGKYVFKYFHDENDNKKIDTNWMGIPQEGYGFSNNAKGKFGPPSFKKMIFELSSDRTMVCKPTYL